MTSRSRHDNPWSSYPRVNPGSTRGSHALPLWDLSHAVQIVPHRQIVRAMPILQKVLSSQAWAFGCSPPGA